MVMRVDLSASTCTVYSLQTVHPLSLCLLDLICILPHLIVAAVHMRCLWLSATYDLDSNNVISGLILSSVSTVSVPAGPKKRNRAHQQKIKDHARAEPLLTQFAAFEAINCVKPEARASCVCAGWALWAAK